MKDDKPLETLYYLICKVTDICNINKKIEGNRVYVSVLQIMLLQANLSYISRDLKEIEDSIKDLEYMIKIEMEEV